MFQLQLKNLDKNLIGNAIILISIVLVVICIGMILTASSMNSTPNDVEWNGFNYYIPQDSQATVTDDSLIVTSSYSGHNVELKKTTDLANYKSNIQKDFANVEKIVYNDTHDFYLNRGMNYGALVPNDAVDGPNADPYKIKENTEIIEITGGNPDYMDSFIASAYK